MRPIVRAIAVGLVCAGWMPAAGRAGDLPVAAELFEAVAEPWDGTPPDREPAEVFGLAGLGIARVPTKYNPRGIEIGRPAPFLVHATATLERPAGSYRLILRARNAARLLVDGEVVAETKPLVRNSSGHEPVPPPNVPEDPRWRPLAAGDQERIVAWESAGGAHRVELWAVVGGKGLRPETGELLAAVVAPGGVPALIGTGTPLTDEGWAAFADAERDRLAAGDMARRRELALKDADYWNNRHARARDEAANVPPKAPPGDGNPIDRHLGTQDATPADDAAFFRRLALDTIGVIPAPAEVEAFLADDRPDKKARAIDARLADPRWADHWMGYWQDVLAENPGLLKPTLNNTGPFRRYVYAAFQDNLPFDRFVTELIRMEGDPLGGGPAGFGVATQNDAPMAAKAQVLAKAFLAADLRCARCHDAPAHPFAQEDLFGLAGLLEGKPQTIPATSTVRRQPGGRVPAVSVSIEAGDKVEPAWNLGEINADETLDGLVAEGARPRERLAALITSPRNTRFAPVMANRLWHRYAGFGLVEPVDDWDDNTRPRHPDLLADLARELVLADYDLKAVARLILNSRFYQARAGEPAPTPRPARRRMSAEQLLDSMFAAAGKPFRAEVLCLDIDGRRPPSEFLNLGRPRRAWELATASNERDRPALALPVVQGLTDLMQAFGWRAARPDAITIREEAITPTPAGVLANGSVTDGRIARLSDDSALTELCLEDRPAEALIRSLTLRILSRPPTPEETARFVAYLGDTYPSRVVPGAARRPPMRESARRVSWSNHLHPDATTIQLEEEKIAREGDPPTARLTPEFRERAEDIVWALVNSPEFAFLP